MQTATSDFSSNSSLGFKPNRRNTASPFLFSDRFVRHTTSPCIIDDQTLLEDDEDDEHHVKSEPIPAPMSASPAALFLSAFSSPKPAAPPPPDSEGSVVGGYTLGGIIGYGAFSTIRKGFSSSGGVVAVKIVRHSDYFKQGNASAARKRIKHEAAVWSTLSHEHILPLFMAVHTRYADFFVTIFCPAGSLFDILKRDGTPALPQDDAGMMFRQVVRGLRYLHEVALYVHRDIKLENVLLDEMGVCRIGDFGMTRRIGEIDEDEEAQNQAQEHEPYQNGHPSVHRAVSLAGPPSHKRPLVLQHSTRGASTLGRHRNSTSSAHPATQPPVFQPGSLPYAAPELLLPQGSSPVAPHPAQDIWALGVLLYALLTGRLPFMDNFEPRLQMKILNGTYEVPPGIGRAEKVLKGCIETDVAARWTIARVDEQAWAVGWGDDVTPADSDEEEEEEYSGVHTPASVAMTPRIPDDTFCPRPMDWQAEEGARSRSSVEAASRRSTSRAHRSLSRAPVLNSRSTSSARPSPSLSHSNEPRKSRAHSPTGGLVINTRVGGEHGADDMRSLSSSRTDTDESASVISPAPSSALLERGRKPRKLHDVRSQSRSTSPSVIHTPSDVFARSPPPANGFELDAEEQEEEDNKERSMSRGRPKYTRFGARTDSMPRHEEGELEVLDEHEGWEVTDHSPVRPRLRPTLSSGRNIRLMSSRSRSKVSSGRSVSARPDLMDETWLSKKRAGSSPPIRKEFWVPVSSKGTPSFVTPASASVLPSAGLMCATPTFSLDGMPRRLTRSKSLEMLKSTTV